MNTFVILVLICRLGTMERIFSKEITCLAMRVTFFDAFTCDGVLSYFLLFTVTARHSDSTTTVV